MCEAVCVHRLTGTHLLHCWCPDAPHLSGPGRGCGNRHCRLPAQLCEPWSPPRPQQRCSHTAGPACAGGWVAPEPSHCAMGTPSSWEIKDGERCFQGGAGPEERTRCHTRHIRKGSQDWQSAWPLNLFSLYTDTSITNEHPLLRQCLHTKHGSAKLKFKNNSDVWPLPAFQCVRCETKGKIKISVSLQRPYK